MVKKPTKKEIDEGTGKEELVLAPLCVIANDPQSAAVQASLKSKAGTVPEDMSRIEILVRPFVSSK